MHEARPVRSMDSPLRHRKAPTPEPLGEDADLPTPSATLENLGPEGRPPTEGLDMDVYCGTSSGSGVRGKPARGSIGDVR